MSSWHSSVREAAPYISLGMQLGLGMAVYVAIGYLLDRYFGTSPWLLLAGALAGLASMVARIVYIARRGRV